MAPRTSNAAAEARPLALAVAALVLANVAWLVVALVRRDDVIRDGADSVTSGALVAWGIAATLLAALALGKLRLAQGARRHAQIFVLSAQFLHATGHLAGYYYHYASYDDLIHGVITAWFGLLTLHVARAWRIIPPRQVTPLRAALIVSAAGVACAGAWEIFEYGADQLFASREQDNLADTMQDMIAGTLGTLAAGAIAYAQEPTPPTRAPHARHPPTTRDRRSRSS